jgi:uncharacterized protein YndB with AHSA1/START domain
MEKYPEAGIKLHPDDTAAVFEIFIKTTPERLWEAITDSELRAKYSFGVAPRSDWTPGSRYEAGVPGVVEIAEGENLEVDRPRRLVQTFTALWSDEVKQEGPSRVTWEIEPVGDSCRLTVTHDQLNKGANGELYGGWPMILSGLKTLLETGELLTTPGGTASHRHVRCEAPAGKATMWAGDPEVRPWRHDGLRSWLRSCARRPPWSGPPRPGRATGGTGPWTSDPRVCQSAARCIRYSRG